jgi:hypothetical protein
MGGWGFGAGPLGGAIIGGALAASYYSYSYGDGFATPSAPIIPMPTGHRRMAVTDRVPNIVRVGKAAGDCPLPAPLGNRISNVASLKGRATRPRRRLRETEPTAVPTLWCSP